MAKVFVLDQQNKQAGTVDFVFSKHSGESGYIFADMGFYGWNRYCAMLQLEESTVLDITGRKLASLYCYSYGQDKALADLVPFGQNRSWRSGITGVIEGSEAKRRETGELRVTGYVAEQRVKNNVNEVVGEISMHWSSEDEGFFQNFVQEFIKGSGVPLEHARTLLEGVRPVIHQNIMNIAGCAALIMKFFDK